MKNIDLICWDYDNYIDEYNYQNIIDGSAPCKIDKYFLR